MFDFRRITVFCLEKRLSKHKMTIFSKNLGGPCPLWPPLATPMFWYTLKTVFNWGNLLNWLFHGLNLYENLAPLLCAYIKILLMAALICTYYIHTTQA